MLTLRRPAGCSGALPSSLTARLSGRAENSYFLGRIAGPWRYDDSPAAHEVGIHHVRPALWLDRSFGEHDVPAAVAATFARGGRNLQRIHGEAVERQTAELWQEAHRAE